MKVLVAGSTGTIGVPLVQALLANGHYVYGLTRAPSNGPLLTSLDAEPIIADAMDRDALLAAVDGLTADAVIHQLPALRRPPVRHRDMARTNALRTRGTVNPLEAANTIGARRFVTQSMIFGYGYGDWGDRLLSEGDRFGPPGRGRLEEHLAAMRSAEHQTFTTEGVHGVALRYGLFYGPGGAIEGLVAPLRRRRLPIPRDVAAPCPGSMLMMRPRPPWPRWNAAVPGRPTTWSTTSRCAGRRSFPPWPRPSVRHRHPRCPVGCSAWLRMRPRS